MLIWRKSVTYRMRVHIFWYFKIQFMSINSCVPGPPFLFSLLYWCIFIALLGIIYRSQFDLCQSVARLCQTQNYHRALTRHFPFLFVNSAQPPRSLCSMQWCMGSRCESVTMRKWQTSEGSRGSGGQGALSLCNGELRYDWHLKGEAGAN